LIRPKAITAAARAAVVLAAVVIFNAPARVEARAGSTLDAAAYVPFVVGNPPTGNCDPSYPTVCIPPPPPDLNCPDVFPLVNFLTLPPDPHGFDRDNDGIGCEDP